MSKKKKKNEVNVGNQGGNTGNQGGNVGNLGGNVGNRGTNVGSRIEIEKTMLQ